MQSFCSVSHRHITMVRCTPSPVTRTHDWAIAVAVGRHCLFFDWTTSTSARLVKSALRGARSGASGARRRASTVSWPRRVCTGPVPPNPVQPCPARPDTPLPRRATRSRVPGRDHSLPARTSYSYGPQLACSDSAHDTVHRRSAVNSRGRTWGASRTCAKAPFLAHRAARRAVSHARNRAMVGLSSDTRGVPGGHHSRSPSR